MRTVAMSMSKFLLPGNRGERRLNRFRVLQYFYSFSNPARAISNEVLNRLTDVQPQGMQEMHDVVKAVVQGFNQILFAVCFDSGSVCCVGAAIFIRIL